MTRWHDSLGPGARAATLIVLLSSGCRQLVGIEARPLEDAGVDAPAAPECPASPYSGCDDCKAQRCDKETKACGEEPDCKAFRACRGACGGEFDCVSGCAAQHSAGNVKSGALDSCVGSGCSRECGFGSEWSCVGAVTWPAIETKALTTTIKLVSALDGTPPPEPVPVRFCRTGDDSCASPAAQGTTDPTTGALTVTLLVNPTSYPNGWEGYVESDKTKSLPVHVWPAAKPVHQSDVVYPAFFYSFQNLALGSNLAKVTLDATRGQVAALAMDCSAHVSPFADVRIQPADPKTVILRPDVASVLTLHKTLDPCRLSGKVLFLNALPGLATLEEYRVDTGEVVGRLSGPVRAGGVSIFSMVPTP